MIYDPLRNFGIISMRYRLYEIPFTPRLHNKVRYKEKIKNHASKMSELAFQLYRNFFTTKLHLPLELWRIIVSFNHEQISKLKAILEHHLTFPQNTANSPIYSEFHLPVSSITRFDYVFVHLWDVLYDSHGCLVHKVHSYGMVIDIGGHVFPRSRACLYGDYGNGCTWIFEHEGEVSTLTFDKEYGYRDHIRW